MKTVTPDKAAMFGYAVANWVYYHCPILFTREDIEKDVREPL